MSWLETVNSRLEAEDALLRAGFGPPRMPVTFIFAPPRGASTPFQQLILSSMRVGYVGNIMARFWKAPYIGALIEKDLQDDRYVSNFRSHLGNTFGPLEPHEWGWFWRHWLRLGGDDHYCSAETPPNCDELGRLFGALEAAKDAPLLFDSVFGMANIEVMRMAIPRVLAAHVVRPPYYVCNSILKGRLARSGDLSGFYGHRPRNIADLLSVADPVEQVVLQVKSILTEMEEDLGRFPPADVFTVHHDELVSDHTAIAAHYAEFLADHGVEVAHRRDPTGLVFENRNTPDMIDPAWRETLNRYYEKHIGPTPDGAA